MIKHNTMKHILLLLACLLPFVICACTTSRCHELESDLDLCTNMTEILGENNDALRTAIHLFARKERCMDREMQRGKKHREVEEKIYNAALYFNAVNITFGGQPFPPDVFETGAYGRIEELGFKFDETVSKEYFTGLTPRVFHWCVQNPDGSCTNKTLANLDGLTMKSANNGTLYSYEWTFKFLEFTGNINGNYTIVPGGGVNITQTGWLRFNCNGTIMRYKMNVPRGRQFGLITNQYPYNKVGLVNAVCFVHQTYCVPAGFSYYTSFNECLTIQNAIYVGDPDAQAAENSNECRAFHTTLAIVDPAVHCQHLGPDSDPCHNWTDDQYYDSLYNLDIPEGQIDPQECSLDWAHCQHLWGV
jgi:hypothetical protein